MFPDDYQPPKNMGLFVDYPFLRHRTNKWELNSIGKFYSALCTALSPWLTCAGNDVGLQEKKINTKS